MPADPPGRAAPAPAVAWWVAAVGAGHRVVGRPAAAARPVQPAVPRLHRDGRGHHRADRRAHAPAGHLAVGRLPGHAAGPHWPAGWALVHDAAPDRRHRRPGGGRPGRRWPRADLPERTWLVLGLLAGLGLVRWATSPPSTGCLAGPLHDALDGVLAPLRNVHKFDPVLRLPLVLGLAHLGRRSSSGAVAAARPAVGLARRIGARSRASSSPARRRAGRRRRPRRSAGRLAPPTGFEPTSPSYWQADRRLAGRRAAQRPGAAAPGSSFGTYVWGSPPTSRCSRWRDSPWEVRNAIPLTPEGHIRMLDAVEERLAAGRGVGRAGRLPGARRHLAPGRAQRPRRRRGGRHPADPGRTRRCATPRDHPGGRASARSSRRRPARRARSSTPSSEPAPAVEVYAVADGGPEGLDRRRCRRRRRGARRPGRAAGAGGARAADRPPAVLPGTAPAGVTATVVSDALVRRERTFGRIADATSAGLDRRTTRCGSTRRPATTCPGAGARRERRAVDGGCADRLELRLGPRQLRRRGPRGRAAVRGRSTATPRRRGGPPTGWASRSP